MHIPWVSLTQPMPGFLGTMHSAPAIALPLAVGWALLVGVCCVAIVRETYRRDAPPPQPWALLATGGALLLLPGVLISLSPKYQAPALVHWGHPYLPVYASVFGAAALISGGLWLALRRTRRSRAWVVVAALIVIASVFVGVADFGNDESVASGFAVLYVSRRHIEERALALGLMKDVPDGAAVVTGGGDWESAEFYRVNAGKAVGPLLTPTGPTPGLLDYATSSRQTANGTEYQFGASRPLYLILFSGSSPNNGYVGLGRVDSLTVGPDGKVSLGPSRPTRIYLSWDPPGTRGAAPQQYTSLDALSLNPNGFIQESSGDHWKFMVPRDPSSPATAPAKQ
jgi:uncharacterized membrane protein HdeD (DUF308 family)